MYTFFIAGIHACSRSLTVSSNVWRINTIKTTAGAHSITARPHSMITA
jgi:hypothetical protein